MTNTDVDLAIRHADTTLASEDTLRPFLEPTFDPAEYFNKSLPSWSSRGSDGKNSDLVEISAHAQTLLSQLNAQLNRLSANLTQFTNEILRSGGRLAYEVEILKGDASTLSDTLSSTLRNEIRRFAPDLETSEADEAVKEVVEPSPAVQTNGESSTIQPESTSVDREAARLRSLATIRNRLDEVVKIFGDAITWIIPPSEVNMKSSFISISAPTQGAESQSLEAKGREYAESVRREITDLINDTARGEEAFEAALSRIESLSDLATLWKGTSEEKARARFVEGLVRLVNDQRRPVASNHQPRASLHAARGSITRI